MLGLRYVSEELTALTLQPTPSASSNQPELDISPSITENSSNINNGCGKVGMLLEVLGEVKGSCAVAVDIINDLLLYEKFDDGIFNLARQELRMGDFFTEAINVFRVQVHIHQLNLSNKYII
jgi:hypothetical protein